MKGKLQPVTIYELFGRRLELEQDGSLEETEARFQQFDEARKLYRKRRWADARQSFHGILDRWPNDRASIAYMKRCQEYLSEEPEPERDGVFTMTHK